MTTSFAAVLPPVSPFLSRYLDPVEGKAAANDNEAEALNDVLLRAALKHFARYGIGAAEQAHAEAERAFFQGDSEGYRWWIAICRTLDRRVASRAAALSRPGPTEPRRIGPAARSES